MQVNFTGIKDPKIFLKYQGVLVPHGGAQGMKVHTIRLDCFLTDKTENSDLSELKRVTEKAPQIYNKFKNFTENDLFSIEVSPSKTPDTFGYNLKFNGTEIEQWDKSIFGICTFICSITKSILTKGLESPKVNKYVKVINLVADKIGKESLNYVN